MFHKSEPQLQQNFQEEAKDLRRLNPGIKEGENVFSPNKTCEHRAKTKSLSFHIQSTRGQIDLVSNQ